LGLPLDCQMAVDALRVGLEQNTPLEEQLPSTMRPVQQLVAASDDPSNKNNNNNNNLPTEYVSFIPAQNMLTCFYSVNNRLALNDLDLLTQVCPRIPPHIPCIAIQGGVDRVCPPDTALAVLQQYPGGNMELRIPLQSGHSMYDVAVANELVRATERMAERLLRQ